jgi:hypothetical protein
VSRFLSGEALRAISDQTGIGPVAVKEIIEVAEGAIADAVLADLDQSFRRAAVEAGLSTLLLHHFSQIITNYRKALSSEKPPAGS